MVPPVQYKQTPFQNRLSDIGEIAQSCNIHALHRGVPGSIPCIVKWDPKPKQTRGWKENIEVEEFNLNVAYSGLIPRTVRNKF